MERWAGVLPALLVGLLFIALGVPLARRRVPPNAWYGFRVARTMRNRDVWYASNAYGGWLMAWLGALTGLFAVTAAALPGMDAERAVGWSLGFMLAGSLALIGLWHRHLLTLDEPPGGAEPDLVEAPPRKLLAALFVFMGILFIGLSIPMVQRQVPPNGTYGFRTPETLGSPEVWYAANAYSGWTMIAAGAAVIVASVGLALSRKVSDRAYVPIMVAVLLLSLGISLALSFRYLATIT